MNIKVCKGRTTWYGWGGFGGSIMQWNPELQIGIAYVPADHICLDALNGRAVSLARLVESAVIEQKKQK